MNYSSENDSIFKEGELCINKFKQLAPKSVEKVNRILEETSSDNVSSNPSNVPTETRSVSSNKSTPIIPNCKYPARMYQKGSIESSSNSSFLHKLMEATLSDVSNINFKASTPLPALESITTPSTVKYKSNDSIFFTPIISTSKNHDKNDTIESLASQLRGMITVIDMGIDLKQEKLNQLEKIRQAKNSIKEKDLKKKEILLKQKTSEHDRKLLDFKLQKKQESERLKEEELLAENNKKEIEKFKNKMVEQGTQLSTYRLNINKLKDEINKINELLEKEKQKNKKSATLIDTLSARLRAKEETERKKAIEEANKKKTVINVNNKRPVSSLSVGGSSSAGSSNTPSPSLPFIIPLPGNISPKESVGKQQEVPVSTDTSKHASTSSTKNVRWQEPLASAYSTESHMSDDVFEDDDGNTGELLNLIPSDMKESNEIEASPEYFRKFFCNRQMYINWFKMKSCKCERLVYENDDLRYHSNVGVTVDILYYAENHQIIIMFNQIRIIAFVNKQLEINRNYGKNEDKTIFTPEGIRYDKIKLSKGYIEEVFDANTNERKRIYPNKQFEMLNVNDEKQSERSDDSYVTRVNNADFIYHPLFELKRKDTDGYDGVFEIQVYHPDTDKNKRLQINICPTESVIHIKHCIAKEDGTFDKTICTTINQCPHLKKRK